MKPGLLPVTTCYHLLEKQNSPDEWRHSLLKYHCYISGCINLPLSKDHHTQTQGWSVWTKHGQCCCYVFCTCSVRIVRNLLTKWRKSILQTIVANRCTAGVYRVQWSQCWWKTLHWLFTSADNRKLQVTKTSLKKFTGFSSSSMDKCMASKIPSGNARVWIDFGHSWSCPWFSFSERLSIMKDRRRHEEEDNNVNDNDRADSGWFSIVALYF